MWPNHRWLTILVQQTTRWSPTRMWSFLVPSAARKMARNVAFMGVMLMAPYLVCLVSFKIVLLSWKWHAQPIQRCLRTCLKQAFMHPPSFAWISLPCTRLTSLINLTQRTNYERARFEKRQRRDLKRASDVTRLSGNILQGFVSDYVQCAQHGTCTELP